MTDIVVYGRGKTGRSLMKLAETRGWTAEMYDDEHGFDFSSDFYGKTVIVSPGVPPTAKGLALAKRSGARITSELSVCFPLCKGKVISVTGTNGKTTVCRMIDHILRRCGKQTYLLGNGGVPFAERVNDVADGEIVVLESSSFQLSGATDFRPAISVFTNIAPDHIDYHGSYTAYIRAKCNNFLHQTAGQYAVFNADDKTLFTISKHAKCNVLYYSVTEKNADCYIDGDDIVLRFCGKTYRRKANFPSPFAHNKSNVLAAVCASVAVGADFDKVVEAIADYVFLPHRLQLFATVGNVRFVDDSKGTNIHATLAATSCFDMPVALIVGGSDKGEKFDRLFVGLSDRVVYIAAVGQTAPKIVAVGAHFGRAVDRFDDYRSAVRACHDAVVATGGVVLLSNACASFDMFDGYAARGDYFQRIVGELYHA